MKEIIKMIDSISSIFSLYIIDLSIQEKAG